MSSAAWPPVIKPMLATAGDPPAGPGWGYEVKWDGIRAVAYLTRTGKVKLLSRNDRDITATYPEMDVLPSLLAGHAAVLDGELVTLDSKGAPSFHNLQRRMHVITPSPALIAAAPVQFVVFDLLYLAKPMMSKPWSERRQALDDLGLAHPKVMTSPVFDGDPYDLLETAREQRLEGIVSKRTAAAYEPGRRSQAWIKTALIQTTEVVIGGYKLGQGRRTGTLGSLMLGIHEPNGELAYVGTGFTESSMLDTLHKQLQRLERTASPFASALPAAEAKGAKWVEPTLVGEVVYRTITPDQRLRHSAWRGLRPDRDPADVVFGGQ